MMNRALGDAPIRLREQHVGMLKESCPRQVRKALFSQEVRSYAQRLCPGRRFYRAAELVCERCKSGLVPVVRLTMLAFRIGKVAVHSLSQQSGRVVGFGHGAG